MERTDFFNIDNSLLSNLAEEKRQLIAQLMANDGNGDASPFAVVAREELSKVLGELRKKAVDKARSAGAGSASSAVIRRLYGKGIAGNVNIASNNKRLSSGGVSSADNGGTQRNRTVSARTKRIRSYTGLDRSFILRWLNEGTDVRIAPVPDRTGRGSMATYGHRGAIPGSSFFELGGELEAAKNELSEKLIRAAIQILQNRN